MRNVLVLSVAVALLGCPSSGTQGPQGPKGDTGAQGPKGDTGGVGPAGSQGATGGGLYTSHADVYCVERLGLYGADGGVFAGVGSMTLSCSDPADLGLTGNCDGQDLSNGGSQTFVSVNRAADFELDAGPPSWLCSFGFVSGHSGTDMPQVHGKLCCIRHKDAGN